METNVERTSTIQEIDIEGMKTLSVVAGANEFNEWMYSTIKPFSTGKILEIGCGIGNIASFYINDGFDIDLSELRQNYITILMEKFNHCSNVKSIFQMDIVAPDFDNKFQHYFKKYDSIYALNIIEHLENDFQGIANCKKLLKPDGKLIILVPAFQCLYNSLDKGLMHFRRYTKRSMQEIILQNGFTIEHMQYFNFPGIFGWWLNGTLLKKTIIPCHQMKFYNFLVPIFKLIDTVTLNQMGLSVICVGKNSR